MRPRWVAIKGIDNRLSENAFSYASVCSSSRPISPTASQRRPPPSQPPVAVRPARAAKKASRRSIRICLMPSKHRRGLVRVQCPRRDHLPQDTIKSGWTDHRMRAESRFLCACDGRLPRAPSITQEGRKPGSVGALPDVAARNARCFPSRTMQNLAKQNLEEGMGREIPKYCRDHWQYAPSCGLIAWGRKA